MMVAGFSSVLQVAESWNPGLEYMGHEVLEAFESRIGHHPFVPWPIFCMLPAGIEWSIDFVAFFTNAKSSSSHSTVPSHSLRHTSPHLATFAS